MPFLRIARNKKGQPRALTHVFVTAGGRVRVGRKPVECDDPAVLARASRDPMVEVVTQEQLKAEAQAELEANADAYAALKASMERADTPAVPAADETTTPQPTPQPPQTPEPTPEAFEVPDAKAADVLDWVADDPARAQAALDVETAKGDGARKGLIGELELLVEAGA